MRRFICRCEEIRIVTSCFGQAHIRQEQSSVERWLKRFTHGVPPNVFIKLVQASKNRSTNFNICITCTQIRNLINMGPVCHPQYQFGFSQPIVVWQQIHNPGLLAQVTLLIQFSSCFICALILTRPCFLFPHKQLFGLRAKRREGGWVVFFGRGAEGDAVFHFCTAESGRVAYRSINIESSRKYNLLPHCSLSGARRIKYIHKHHQNTNTHTRTNTHTHKPIKVSTDHSCCFF